jgi:glyoxylase-like metal-dependent hydrolase (beta-lactamase superfamily II)/rhodanese-related sulfurtransferase
MGEFDELAELLPEGVDVASVDPEELRDRIDSGEQVTILDVRVQSEYEEWQIDGENVTTVNIPYFEFIEGVDDDLLSSVPEGDPVVAVCAKGGASMYVAGTLLDHGIEAVNMADGMNGWARIYDVVEVSRAPGPATVLQLQRPSSGCLSYLVHHDGEGALVDPLRAFTDFYADLAEDLDVNLAYAVDTHIHADHVSGVRAVAERTGAETVLSAGAIARGVEYDIDLAVEDGDVLSVGDATVEVRPKPGHTSGMTSYLVDDGVLLTGDGLFVESVARPDLEEGAEGAPDAARQLYDALMDVLDYPDDTVIAPAHFSDSANTAADGSYTALLGDLTDRMEALSMDREAFVTFILEDMPPRPGNFEEIIETNLGQRDVDDEKAFELELGPNNCAATRESIADD